jgi:hypothetical protein
MDERQSCITMPARAPVIGAPTVPSGRSSVFRGCRRADPDVRPGGVHDDAGGSAWRIAARRNCRPPGRTRRAVSARRPALAPLVSAMRPRAESGHQGGGPVSHRQCTRSAAAMPGCRRACPDVRQAARMSCGRGAGDESLPGPLAGGHRATNPLQPPAWHAGQHLSQKNSLLRPIIM